MHPVFYQFALGLWGILPGNYSGIAPVSDQVYAIANCEGVCWGPTLSNGRRTLLLIADSQKGYGNKIYHLRDSGRTRFPRIDIGRLNSPIQSVSVSPSNLFSSQISSW